MSRSPHRAIGEVLVSLSVILGGGKQGIHRCRPAGRGLAEEGIVQLDVRPLCRLAHIGRAQHLARMNPPDPVAGLNAALDGRYRSCAPCISSWHLR
jgi:hypothetical protein